MSYLTRSDLQTMVSAAKSTYRLNESVSKAAAVTDVFLSYSHADPQLVAIAAQLLQSQGVSVYVDKDDRELPDKASPETAKQLRSRITACKKFVLIASSNSASSKWVSWELGYADGKKVDGCVAVLPVQENWGNWENQEYIQLYPKIEKDALGQLRIVSPGEYIGSSKTLSAWLS